MMTQEYKKSEEALDSTIKEYLIPLVKKVDADALYPESYLIQLGREGHFRSDGLARKEVMKREADLVHKTSRACMTTGFNLWCHLAALTYLRMSDNEYLKSEILPSLENGEYFGGTGLSNPMKYYSGMEPLHLKAERHNGGYSISGNLASVSNLKEDHWFGVIASAGDSKEVMAFVPCNREGLSMKEKTSYIGVNGSATYACKFDEVDIPDEWIISTDAASFVDRIRPAFLFYQIPLGLGVTEAAVRSMQKAPNRQGDVNQYLPVQPGEIEAEYRSLKDRLDKLADSDDLQKESHKLKQLRLDIDSLTIRAAHGDMLYYGGAGYIRASHPSRRLRETYFLLNLTPTVKQLEKELA